MDTSVDGYNAIRKVHGDWHSQRSDHKLNSEHSMKKRRLLGSLTLLVAGIYGCGSSSPAPTVATTAPPNIATAPSLDAPPSPPLLASRQPVSTAIPTAAAPIPRALYAGAETSAGAGD